MNPAVEKVVKPIVDRSVNVASNALGGTREAVVSGAHMLERSERPVKILTEAGLRLNKITHESIASLVKVEARMIGETLQAAAHRLETAANANSLRSLVDDQVALMPKTRERLTRDARKTLDVLVDTRDELRDMVMDTVKAFNKSNDDLSDRARRTAKKATRSAEKTVSKAGKTARRTTKKATAKARKKTSKAGKTVRKTVRKATR